MATRFEQIKSNIKSKSDAQRESFRREYREFFDHPLLFVALIMSGLLSAIAGIVVGLGMRIENGAAVVNFDIAHVFFAILYAVAFPYFFEFGLANWLHKLLHREPDNVVQFWTSWVMIAITFIGTAATAYSAMDVLVTAGGFFDSFVAIPPIVQKWIAFSLPTMIMLNIAAGELYRQFTTEAILKRSAENELREAQVAADMEIKLAQVEADKTVSIHAAEEYSRRAEREAPEIGRKKGEASWQARTQKDTAQPQQSHQYSAETEARIDELERKLQSRIRELEAKQGADPTQGRGE